MWDTYLTSAFFIHCHICGGMPLGFLAAHRALGALGSGRGLNMAKLALVKTGFGHAAGCFADGVQFASGSTFGKGLIERTEYGKWALTLLERDTQRALRVSVRPEVMLHASFESPFVRQRKQGVAPTDIPVEISKPLVERRLGRSAAELFEVSDTFEYPQPQRMPASFNLLDCSVCGEAVAENKARIKEGKVFIPCSGQGR